jgi:CRP/FNR family transcriptional regulator, cyclic AMP receptor protein
MRVTVKYATPARWRRSATLSAIHISHGHAEFSQQRINEEEVARLTVEERYEFELSKYLSTAGVGRQLRRFRSKHAFFNQGGNADAIFYILTGRAKLTVVSKRGKEATVTLLTDGDFVGEESLAGPREQYRATACAISACFALKITRDEMNRVLQEEHTFADLFLRFLLARGMRTQADLIDQLFNSSERRLARALLLMANYGRPGEPEVLIPPITQETLADMIGTTRSRVSFFMNRFRALGYIKYKGRIRVHKSLLNVLLTDQLPDDNSSRPDLFGSSNRGKS